MHGGAGTRQDNEAAMHGDAGAKGEKERKKRRKRRKKEKRKKNEWGKQATEVPSPLEVLLTRPHSAISARAGAMGARWGM